jgi:thioredoxin reductase (NADPH)
MPPAAGLAIRRRAQAAAGREARASTGAGGATCKLTKVQTAGLESSTNAAVRTSSTAIDTASWIQDTGLISRATAIRRQTSGSASLEEEMLVEVVIIGAGCAGLAAALALREGGTMPIVLEQFSPGGEAVNVRGEIYPSRAFDGSQVAADLTDDALGADLDIRLAQVEHIGQDSQGMMLVQAGREQVKADIVVLATGTGHRGLSVPGALQFEGRGMSTCAACDGPLLAPGPVLVTGTTRHALWECSTLIALGVPVLLAVPAPLLLTRLGTALAGEPLVTTHPDAVVEGIDGSSRVESATLSQHGSQLTADVTGVVAADVFPRSELIGALASTEDSGAIVVDSHLQSSHDRIYAIGEVRSGFGGYIVAAIADGLAAASAVLQRAAQRDQVSS